MMKRGFTLIELLVVISIIGLLASVVLASTRAAVDKAVDSKKVQMASEYIKAFELYNNTYGGYPELTENTCLGRGNTDGLCLNGQAFESTDLNNEMSQFIPGPPSNIDPVTIGGSNFSGIGYLCISYDSPCTTYAMFWVTRAVTDSCAGGFTDNTGNPLGVNIPASNSLCVYTNNRAQYDLYY